MYTYAVMNISVLLLTYPRKVSINIMRKVSIIIMRKVSINA